MRSGKLLMRYKSLEKFLMKFEKIFMRSKKTLKRSTKAVIGILKALNALCILKTLNEI